MPPLLLAVLTVPIPTPATTGPIKSAGETVQTIFNKVGPAGSARSPGQERAVVLIHGLGLHPLSQEKAVKPSVRHWQKADSPLVQRLSRDSDVYALAYSQNASVEQIASSPDLPRHIQGLKAAGYRQIVLVGHSAGGLIGRELVEDNPGLGAGRVIQVCSPNTGSAWAALKTARAAQLPFLVSLTRSGRQKAQGERTAKRLPEAVAFACVVGSCRMGGDGLVPCRSQWSADLQAQGVPAFPLRTTHWEAMTCPKGVELLARLVVEPLPRWDERKVIEARKTLLGN